MERTTNQQITRWQHDVYSQSILRVKDTLSNAVDAVMFERSRADLAELRLSSVMEHHGCVGFHEESEQYGRYSSLITGEDGSKYYTIDTVQGRSPS